MIATYYAVGVGGWVVIGLAAVGLIALAAWGRNWRAEERRELLELMQRMDEANPDWDWPRRDH